MAILNIMREVCEAVDVLFYDGTVREVTDKLARTGAKGLKKYPAVLFFTDSLSPDDNGFYLNYDLMFLIVNSANPREYGKAEDFDKQYEIKDDILLQMAKDSRITGIKTNRQHNPEQKYLINGTDKLAVLEVTINDFLIKKYYCNV